MSVHDKWYQSGSALDSGDGGGYEADRMAKVVENYYEKLEENIRAITEKFRKEMMEDFQKLREKWRSEREEAKAAMVAANKKKEKAMVKATVVGKRKKKLIKKRKKRRKAAMEVGDKKRRKTKRTEKTRVTGDRKKKKKRREAAMVIENRKKKKKRIKKKRTKGRRRTWGKSWRMAEIVAGAGDNGKRTFNIQARGHEHRRPEGRRRTEQASSKTWRGLVNGRRLRRFMNGSFRGGGVWWNTAEVRRGETELGFWDDGERTDEGRGEGRKPFLVGEREDGEGVKWKGNNHFFGGKILIRKMEEREGEDMRRWVKEEDGRLFRVGQMGNWEIRNPEEREDSWLLGGWAVMEDRFSSDLREFKNSITGRGTAPRGEESDLAILRKLKENQGWEKVEGKDSLEK